MSEHDSFLETGYEQTSPIGDTYLRRFLMNWLEANEAIGRSLDAATVRDSDFWATDAGRPASYANTATLIRPLPSNPSEIMRRMESFFAAQDGTSSRESYIFSPWPTPNLRLFGWHLGGHPPLHLLPMGMTRPPLPPEFKIERVTTPQSLAIVERVAAEGFPMEDIDASVAGSVFGAELLSKPNLRFWLGWHQERPVGVAVMSIDHGINQVMLVTTLPDARGRGFGEALTWEASLADPALPAMLLSSDLGRRVYDRMGYLPLFRWTVWYRSRS
jgi:hypothetical protein